MDARAVAGDRIPRQTSEGSGIHENAIAAVVVDGTRRNDSLTRPVDLHAICSSGGDTVVDCELSADGEVADRIVQSRRVVHSDPASKVDFDTVAVIGRDARFDGHARRAGCAIHKETDAVAVRCAVGDGDRRPICSHAV